MTFVNEKISEVDRQKYGITEINKKECTSDYKPEWTRDHERDIYLRWMNSERDQPGRTNFTFYWKGTLFPVTLKRAGDGVRGGMGWNTWSIWAFSNRNYLQIPSQLECHREEIVLNLKEALTAFKDFGTHSAIADHTAQFTF
jgi:hypothetical protein